MRLSQVCSFTKMPPSLLGGNSLRSRHSCESGNPAQKDWIPGQARNDNQSKETYETLL